nr:uracil-DNA glycosylase [Rhodoferax sp.]
MSLDLDDRQRAMLQEMGVRVWLPQAAAPVVLPAAQAVMQPARMAAKPVVASAPEKTASHARITAAETPSALHLRPEGIDGMDWPALQQAVSGCQACKLCADRKNTVFGVGQATTEPRAAPRADWLVVGEAPGENEDRTGEPFVGQAGQLLDNMLKAIGLDRRNKVYIANVIKCRPPGNRNPEPQEVAQCEPYLRRQIELLQPKIILAMGRFAVNSLLQATLPDVHKLPLGKLRGQVHSYQSAGRNVPVIATYHPAYLLRNLPEKAKAWADLCLALDLMRQEAPQNRPAS